MRLIIFLIVVQLWGVLPVFADEEIKIALRANRGAEKGLARWQPTADYLSSQIPGYRFSMIPFENNSELNQAVSRGDFHFVLTNPASAVEHTIRYGTQHIATLSNKRQGKGYTKFGSVIFTRSDRNDINDLQDLRGKTFMGVDEIGFGGWRVAWLELLKHNIDPYQDFKEIRFGGGVQPNVVNAVLSGKVDAGSVRTDMLERMAAKGKIKLSDIKVLNLHESRDFPFLHSSTLYPEWSFSRTKVADEAVANKVATSLLIVNENHVAAKAGKYMGWVIPSNYQSVSNLLKELKVGPFHTSSHMEAKQFWSKYLALIISVFTVFVFLVGLTIYIIKTNRRLQQAQNNLESEMAQRKNVEVVLSDLAKQGLVSNKEEAFFKDCLTNLADLYHCKYALIGLFSNADKTHIRTFLVFVGDRFASGFEFPIKNSPCEDILNLKLELIDQDVVKRYPTVLPLLEMGVESYFGSPLREPNGSIIGLIAVMDTKPMNPPDWARPILRIFANRVGMEIHRKNQDDELQNMANKMSYQASHDPLTGLINRREIEERLSQALNTAINNGQQHALCFLDLDQFKVVNDTCGHMAGDELLKQLALKFSSKLRENDTIGRLGGDEFGILLLDCPMDKTTMIAITLLEVANAFRFAWQDNVFRVSVSIGITSINKDCISVKDLLREADAACYIAKELGRNRLHIYKEGDEEVIKRQGEMKWISELTWALQKNSFELYCQTIKPINKNLSPETFHEILVRMRNKDGELLLPGSFINAAERYNLMPTLDRWVIQNTFQYLQKIGNSSRENNKAHSIYFINISGLSFNDKDFKQFVTDMLAQYQISPKMICFEITETAAISNFSQALEFISKLRTIGLHFALDDFGTGLCSYSYLQSLPIDFIKLDGQFINGIKSEPMNRAIVESVSNIARTIGVLTIAEWVEDEDVIEELKDINIDYAQGYAIDAPEKLPA